MSKILMGQYTQPPQSCVMPITSVIGPAILAAALPVTEKTIQITASCQLELTPQRSLNFFIEYFFCLQ